MPMMMSSKILKLLFHVMFRYFRLLALQLTSNIMHDCFSWSRPEDLQQKLLVHHTQLSISNTCLQEHGNVFDDVPEDEVVLGGVKPAELGEPAEERHHGLHHERLHLWPCRQVVQDVVPCRSQHMIWNQWQPITAALTRPSNQPHSQSMDPSDYKMSGRRDEGHDDDLGFRAPQQLGKMRVRWN